MLAVHPYSCECNSAVEMRREMVIKVAVADRFRFKMVPSIRNLYMLGTREVHYIGGQRYYRHRLMQRGEKCTGDVKD